ncbi:MAG: STAS domain-containing protein [Campylobacteraceae bacterium]|nr:STAS domain-containing protein [Campylobacteraceae bacterium]
MKLKNEHFTIYEVEKLKDEFIKELGSHKKVIIDLANIKKIDMPAIQLLLSLKISCNQVKKPFELKNIPENIFKSFQISGCDTALGV